MKKTVAVLSALAFTLSACGGGADEATAKKNLAADFDSSDSLGGTTKEQSTCVANGAVDELGVDTLQEYGILDKDLKVNKDPGDVKMKDDDAKALAGAVVDCISAEDFLKIMFGDQSNQLPAEAKACIEEAMTDEKLEEMLAATFSGDDTAAQSGLQKDLTECVMGNMGQ